MEFPSDENPSISFDSDGIGMNVTFDHPMSSPNLDRTPAEPLQITNTISNVCGRKGIPYRIVHLSDLLLMVNDNLAECSGC